MICTNVNQYKWFQNNPIERNIDESTPLFSTQNKYRLVLEVVFTLGGREIRYYVV